MINSLAALLCYGVTFYGLAYFSADAVRVGGAGLLLYTGALGGALIYLAVRLYTKRDTPWPGWKISILWLYAICLGMSMIAWPSFRDIVIKSAAGATHNKLIRMRAGLAGYMLEHQAAPENLSQAVPEIPDLVLPLLPHTRGRDVRVSTFTDIQDSGHWLYVRNSSAPVIIIDCTHERRYGHVWSAI